MGFSFYKACTIQTGQVPSSQSGFPALVPFLAGDSDFATIANGGRATNSSGFDIRPYSDSALTSALTFELKNYAASTGAFEMWVNMTAVDGGVVYMGVGNPGLTTDGSSSSTWDSNFYGVYHLGDGSTLSLADSSQSGNTLTNNNTVTAAAGQVGGAASFARASSQWLAKTGASQPAAITISGWVKASSLVGSYNSAFQSANATDTTYVLLLVTSGGGVAEYVHPGVTDAAYDPGSHTLSTGTWYHLALTYSNAAGLVGYVNGASDGTDISRGAIVSGTVETTLGRDPADGTRYWNGQLDEAHFSNIVRSGNWLKTEYNNQLNLSAFWSKGSLVGVQTYPKLERGTRGLMRGIYQG